MSQAGNLNTGGSPVAAGGAHGNHRNLRQVAGDFAQHPLAMAGLIVLALALLDTLVAPLLSNTETITGDFTPLQGPSVSHQLGTDGQGRDELAQLLYGVHSSMLLVGATLALAAVVAAVVLAYVHLLGRTRGQEWAPWADVVLTPVVGVLLLGGASLVVSRQSPSGVVLSPNLFSYVFTTPRTFVLQHPFSIGTEIQQGTVDSFLILILLVGELVRVVYLLVQRLRRARAPQPRVETAPVTPAWVSVAVPAVAIGLWVAADALLLEDLLEGYVSLVNNSTALVLTPSLGLMFGQSGGFINQASWLVLTPLVAILVLYASLNLVGFGLRGVLLRSPESEQH
jgi:ABC-type antimicrobial peptide transport system permease subunit